MFVGIEVIYSRENVSTLVSMRFFRHEIFHSVAATSYDKAVIKCTLNKYIWYLKYCYAPMYRLG